MLQPNELKMELPMHLSNGVVSTTTKVWEILLASYNGDLTTVKKMVAGCPALIYAQYNYTPPIHFAVREGHTGLVKYLLDNGAHDPSYRIYPFLDTLQTIAGDRGYDEICSLLEAYCGTIKKHYSGDNGAIDYQRTPLQKEFEKAVDKEDINRTQQLLQQHPGLALDETFFWGEGILMKPAKINNQALIKLLMGYGAKVPAILKWVQFYYFEHNEGAPFMMENGMDPNTMSWHYVTVLHDMAQKGNLAKAALLLKHGASINVIEEEYRSTPLGMASRWGHAEMVKYLLSKGADPNLSGASWSTPMAWAKKKDHVEIEKILSNAGAK